MNFTSSNKSMNPGPLGELDSLPSSINIILTASSKATNDRHKTILINRITDRLRNDSDGLKIVVGGGGEAGHDDVDAELGELAGDVELLLAGHGGAGGLFAVAEGGVEDADVVGVRDAIGDVGRPRSGTGGGAENGGEWG
ncbi:unnamed protein product [Camellia sinensis]